MSAVLLHCCSSLLRGSHDTRAAAHQVCMDHYYACVDIAYRCLLCAMITRACVQVCAGLCRCAGTPHSSFLFFFALSARCCCCRITSSVSHRPSNSQALYFVTATVQQQSHSKFVWTSSMRVLCVYAMCVRALIRAHMAYANIAAAMFKVNNVVRQQEFLLTTITVIPIRYI